MLKARVRALFSFRPSPKRGRPRHQGLGLNVALPGEPDAVGNAGRPGGVDSGAECDGPEAVVTLCPPAGAANGVAQLSDPAVVAQGSQIRQDGSRAGNARLFHVEDEGGRPVPKADDGKAEHARVALPPQSPRSAASGEGGSQPADWGASIASRLQTLEAEVAALRQVNPFADTDDSALGVSLLDLTSRQPGPDGDSDDRRLNAELRQLRQSVRELRERVLTQGTILWALEQALRDHVAKMEAQVAALTKRLGEGPDPEPLADSRPPAAERGGSADRAKIDTATLVNYLKCNAEAIRAVCDAVGDGAEAWARAAAVARRHPDLAPAAGGERPGLPPE